MILILAFFVRKSRVEGKLKYEGMADADILVSIPGFAKQQLPVACFL